MRGNWRFHLSVRATAARLCRAADSPGRAAPRRTQVASEARHRPRVARHMRATRGRRARSARLRGAASCIGNSPRRRGCRGSQPLRAGFARAPAAKIFRSIREKFSRRVGRAADAARPMQVAGSARHRPRVECASRALNPWSTGTSYPPARRPQLNPKRLTRLRQPLSGSVH